MDGLPAFLMAGFALTGSPGPATLSLAATGAAFGARRGLAFMAGIAVGVLAVMGITASGVTGLLVAMPNVTVVLAALAAAYILYLAYRIATAPPLAEGAGEGRPPSFAGGLFLSLANPKAYAAMAALFSGFVLIERQPALDAVIKTAILMAIILMVDFSWLVAGSALTRLCRRPAINRAVNVTFALLLVLSVAFALLL